MPKRMWRKMHDLVYLAGVFWWAAESSPSLSLCTRAILILLAVFAEETSPVAKETNKEITPRRKKPMMLPRQMVPGAAPLPAADTPQPPLPPHGTRHGFSRTSPSALSSSAPGIERASGHLHLCPPMPAPAGCFVSVALLPDLPCFLPRGCGQRKSQHVGFPLAGSQLRL